MNSELMTRAQKLAAKEYLVVITEDTLSNGELIYLAEHPELPGCMAQGNTVEKAIEELKEARIDYIYFLLEDGLEVPEPNLHPSDVVK